MSQALCKGNNFPLFPVPCSPYLRRYIFHGSESFSWTSAFTALPKCCVGSPAPAWLPSPSVLTFNRLPRPALDLDIWNKKTRCIKPRTQLWTLPVRVPSGLSQAKLRLQRFREKTRSLQRLPQLHQQNLVTLALLHPPPSYPKVWWKEGNVIQVGKNSGST